MKGPGGISLAAALVLVLALGACREETAPPGEVAPSPAQILEQASRDCARRGGQMMAAGLANAKVCIRDLADGGKQCRKASDCSGDCLARSGTCAPVTPLFGCNEILMDQGQRAVLCRD